MQQLSKRKNTMTALEFLRAAKPVKMILAFDATISRSSAWGVAVRTQEAIIIDALANCTNLNLMIGYFRALDECKFTPWLSDPDQIKNLMNGIQCEPGRTQIEKILKHAIDLGATSAVFVGDSMEEFAPDVLAMAEAQKCPWHMVQDKSNWNYSHDVEPVFRQIAEITGGTYLSYGGQGENENEIAHQLTESMRAISTLSTMGIAGLIDMDTKEANLLLEQT